MLATLFATFALFAQEPPAATTQSQDSIFSEETKGILRTILEVPSGSKDYDNVAWKLYPTNNMWTFLKLNTRNGVIFQLQFDVNGENRMETILNISVLATGADAVNGRFALYPTQNIWTFILLDQIDERAWQVQWSQDENKRTIIPIVGASHLKDLAN